MPLSPHKYWYRAQAEKKRANPADRFPRRGPYREALKLSCARAPCSLNRSSPSYHQEQYPKNGRTSHIHCNSLKWQPRAFLFPAPGHTARSFVPVWDPSQKLWGECLAHQPIPWAFVLFLQSPKSHPNLLAWPAAGQTLFPCRRKHPLSPQFSYLSLSIK